MSWLKKSANAVDFARETSRRKCHCIMNHRAKVLNIHGKRRVEMSDKKVWASAKANGWEKKDQWERCINSSGLMVRI